MSKTHSVQPFTIDIPDAQLDDMLSRLRRTRFPDDFGNGACSYGDDTTYHRELIN